MDNDRIKKEAKQILDKFAKALAKVDSEKVEIGVDRDEFERKEGEGEECEKDFKQKMLENAPNHDDDFVIAERGSWK